MSDEVDFMSDEWLSALEQTAQTLLDASTAPPGPAFTYIELFTDAPEPRPDGRHVGYVLTIDAGKASVVPGVGDDDKADCTVKMSYSDALASTDIPSGPALSALMGRGYAAGTLVMTGSMAGVPIDMTALHDELCRRTRAV